MNEETILIIEDSRANMKLMSLILEKSGYRVLKAETARDGIALARSSLPSLILMDIQLPGMSGLEATQILKADSATQSIPIIAVTALAMNGDEERIRDAGCDGYLTKPIQYQHLLAYVQKILNHEEE